MVKQGFSKLRNKAEYSFNAGGQNIGQLEKGDLAGINCQLAVHQKQLEAENREIRESWALVKAARDFYLDLFNLAPVGYFVIDEHNRIIEANLTGCRLLQTDKRKIRTQLLPRLFPKAASRVSMRTEGKSTASKANRLWN